MFAIVSAPFNWNMDSFSNEKGTNGLLFGANRRAYLNEFFALFVKSYGSFSPWTFLSHVVASVLRSRRYFQIYQSIVIFYIILVVNNFIREKRPPQFFGHKSSMLVVVHSIYHHSHIAVWTRTTLSCVAAISRTIMCFSGLNLPSRPDQRGGAVFTFNLHGAS